MATKNLNTRIVLRNDTKAHWQSVNPILMKGELGVEFDPSATSEGRKILFKIGDGVTSWNNLPYYSDPQASNIVDFSSHSWGTISVEGESILGFTISADEYQEALRSSGIIMPVGSGDPYNQIAVASGEMADSGSRLFDYLKIDHTYADWPERVSITLYRYAVTQNPENPSQYICGLITQENTDLSDVFAALDGFNAGYTVASAINDVSAVASAAQGTADSAASAATSAASAAAAAQTTANTAYSTAAAAMDILNNATSGLVSRVEVIEQDHLTSADKQELNDAIATVSASAAAANQAINVLNGTVGVAGSVIKTVTDTINATGGVADRISNIEAILPAASFSSSQTVAGAINALDSRIDALEGNHFVVVETLPATGQSNIIYLVPDANVGYKEWIYIKVSSNPDTYAWEEIGDTNIDLSNYYNKSESDARFAPVTHNHDDRYYTKNYIDQNILDETQSQSLAYRIKELEDAGYATVGYVDGQISGLTATYVSLTQYSTDQASQASFNTTINNRVSTLETAGYATQAWVTANFASKSYVDNNFVNNTDVLILDCGNASTNYSAS